MYHYIISVFRREAQNSWLINFLMQAIFHCNAQNLDDDVHLKQSINFLRLTYLAGSCRAEIMNRATLLATERSEETKLGSYRKCNLPRLDVN